MKLYDVVRTAHLERVRGGAATTILHRFQRYDFDKELASTVDLRAAGVLGAFCFGLTNDVDVIEINEPLVARAAPRALAIMTANRIRAAVLRTSSARVVSYAIANKDPRIVANALPMKSRWKWRLEALLIPAVWRHLDRLVFGTSHSYDLYRSWFPDSRRWPTHCTIDALPVARIAGRGDATRARSLIFVGDFSARKGFDKVLSAWPRVREAVPDASLVLLGKGVGVNDALHLASCDDRVRVEVDPARPRIFEEMSAAKVLILPSQPTKLWREQVGLPIVEGLSMGCVIVTTDETGLAQWLSTRGHWVVAESGNVSAIAQATVAALMQERSPRSVVQDLPKQDGREAAEDWMFEAGDQ
ncbi:glycosyltransferase [Tessaracoccus antarcticus]|uniref:glycosyltransferase n=1 Tax=Tessaracoccus antarcticus TaxID=2479848 RepID=UPI001F2D760E|nr:glycosyltransferase [Tessaracoccus antarcticus]